MKIGFLSLPLSGHLNPMTALARKLQSRGIHVVFFGVPDVEHVARTAGLTFVPFGEKEYPVGSTAKVYGPVAKLHGEDVLKVHLEETTPPSQSGAGNAVSIFHIMSSHMPRVAF